MSARGRPAAWLGAFALGLAIVSLPGWLYQSWFAYPALRGDDFAFLASSRSGAEPMRDLWTPHNAHVVPLFRLMTAGLCRLAGPLGQVPATLSLAAHVLLVLSALVIGHLVAWETGRVCLGLAAMAVVALSTVLHPAVTWYSAAQTLLTGVLILGALAMAQVAVLAGRRLWLVPSALAVLAAPLAWSGGLAAGPAVAAYLLAQPGARWRRPAMLPALSTVAAVLVILAVAGPSLWRASGGSPAPAAWPGPRPLTHTAQAVVESLVLGNLGVEAATTPAQAVVLCGGLAAVWWASRRGRGPLPNGLEAAGVALVALPYGMAFTLRSGYAYDNLRDLGWYDTLPQIGAVLFTCGWIAAPVVGPRRPEPPTHAGFVGLAAVVLILLMLHQPRAEALRIAEAPPWLPSETRLFPIPSLKWLRARTYAEDRAGRQSRALNRLEQAATMARAGKVDRAAIRAAFGRLTLPGWPVQVTEIDALDLVAIPDTGRVANPASVRAALATWLVPEPYPKPDFLAPDEPWPPVDWATVP